MVLRIASVFFALCLVAGLSASVDAGEACCGGAAEAAADKADDSACQAAAAGADCSQAKAACADCPGPDKCPHHESCPHADCACKQAAATDAPKADPGE